MFIPDSIRRHREKGLTFVELVMFIVIVSVAVTGVLLVMNLTTSRSADPQRQKQALAIAESLMEEILASRFTFCDPTDATAETASGAFVGGTGCTSLIENAGREAGEARPFDNVSDYVNGYGAPLAYANDVAGIAFPAGYAASVAISAEALNGIPSDAAPANTNALRIRVTVSYGNDSIVLDGYRTRYAPIWIP